jgi:hypothetical protein
MHARVVWSVPSCSNFSLTNRFFEARLIGFRNKIMKNARRRFKPLDYSEFSAPFFEGVYGSV